MPKGLLKRLTVDATIVLTSLALVWAAWIHLCALRSTGPLEYREDSMLLLTDFLRHGGNPFALQNLPLYTAVYGIAYNLFVLPLTWFMGSGYLPHRLVSAVFAIASCVLVGWAIRRRGAVTAAAVIGGILLYLDLAARSTPNFLPAVVPEDIISRPDSMALFLFLSSLVVPWRYEFNRRSLIASIALSIAAFLTKPYFVFGAGVVAAYVFFFRSIGRGLMMGVVSAAAFAATVAIGTWLGPCFYAIIISGNGNSEKYRSWPHLLAQLEYYGKSVPGCIVLCIAATIFLARHPAETHVVPEEGSGRWTRPLLHWNFDFFVFTMLVSLAVLLAKLGPHAGNSMLYFYQLLSPLLFIIAFAWVGTPSRWGSAWMALLVTDLILFLASKPIAPADHSAELEQWRSLLVGQTTAYVAPPLAWLAHREGLAVFDTGMTEFFVNTVEVSSYPPQQKLREQLRAFYKDVNRRVQHADFDVIVLADDNNDPMFSFVRLDVLRQKYIRASRMFFPFDWEPSLNGIVYIRKSMVKGAPP